ncbi:helix-turn-helix transcriptional regulator [uncultured Croceitalea sp.]|uniref:helix-turn-helix domain-containing protein n=1 Tax=uncultured Croceitalea sp. TaxID=1798908 RepID=UPI003305DC1E
MKTKVKEIVFKNKGTSNFSFDLVDLESILDLRPKDHNQFDHHKISFYVIIIITEKKGLHSINYKNYKYKKGTIFTLRKNSIHKFVKSNAKGKFLVFTEDFAIQNSNKKENLRLFQLFNEMLSSPKLQLTNNDFDEIENLLQQIEKEYLELNDEYSAEVIRSLVQVLIHKLFRIKSAKNDNLKNHNYHLQFMKLQELVENECFESKKAVYYANKMGVTTRTLNNIVKNTINKSVKSFIDEIVILQIKRLLANSQLSFTEIAYKSGFDDPTNFFKYFKKNTRLSPKQFREDYN